MSEKNRLMESSGIAIMVVTILILVTWQTYLGNILIDVCITFYVICIPFVLGLYFNASAPAKTQLVSAIWGVFMSLLNKKLSIPDGMKQIEIIILNAVNLWNDLNQVVYKDADKNKKKPPIPPETSPGEQA